MAAVQLADGALAMLWEQTSLRCEICSLLKLERKCQQWYHLQRVRTVFEEVAGRLQTAMPAQPLQSQCSPGQPAPWAARVRELLVSEKDSLMQDVSQMPPEAVRQDPAKCLTFIPDRFRTASQDLAPLGECIVLE